MSHICPVCKHNKVPDSGASKICVVCQRRYVSLLRKKKCLEYLGGKCKGCGRTDPETLTFHHIVQQTKSFNIADWISCKGEIGKLTWEQVKSELDKVEIQCHNCHRLIHAQHYELKDFIPYLSPEQRQNLNPDIITDDDVFGVINDNEVVDELLMDPNDIPVTDHSVTRHYSSKVQEDETEKHREYTKNLIESSNKKMSSKPGGILGIVDNKVSIPTLKCSYCGTTFRSSNSDKLFCSGYCESQMREEVEENGQLALFEHLLKYGWVRTQAVYRMGKTEISTILGFNS